MDQSVTPDPWQLPSPALPQDQMPSDPVARDAWQWWKTKKWALHIAYRMFNR